GSSGQAHAGLSTLAMTASRRRLGTISRKSHTELAGKRLAERRTLRAPSRSLRAASERELGEVQAVAGTLGLEVGLPGSRSGCWADSPVTLPPGRAREATRPVPTGSAAAAKTIGMVDVACFAARTIGTAYVTIISTLSRTNSAANTAARSEFPSAQR